MRNQSAFDLIVKPAFKHQNSPLRRLDMRKQLFIQ